MDGLGRILAGPAPAFLDGREYWCEPLNLGRLASCENYLLSRRRSPIDVAEDASRLRPGAEALCADLLRLAVQEVTANKAHRVVPLQDLKGWLYSRDGVALSARLCIQALRERRQSEVLDFFSHHPSDARGFVRVRDMISGLDVLSSCDWPPPAVYPARDADGRPHPKAGQPLPTLGPKYHPWKRILRGFAEAYYWPPETVASLTLYSAVIYWIEPDSPALGGLQERESPGTAARKNGRAERWLEPRDGPPGRGG